MVLHGNLDHATQLLNRASRYTIAKAEGDTVEEHLGILHTTTVPEFTRSSYYVFAKPLFTMFDLMGLRESLTTDSIKVKLHTPAIVNCLRECRVLLGTSGWNGKDLSPSPTYKQMVRFLSDMLTVLIDGTFTTMSVTKKTVDVTVEVADTRRKSGKTTRKKREKVMDYELQFEVPEKPKGAAYTALERIEHLTPLDL